MTQASIITDEMRAQIGVESDPVTLEVDRTAVRMFARAVGYSDPIYFDEAAAKARGYRSLPAPFAFLGHPIFDPHSPQRPYGARLESGLKRILNGGTDIEYLDTVCAGDTLTATTKLIDLSEREGRLGPMLVAVTETTYRRDGNEVARARNTLIQY